MERGFEADSCFYIQDASRVAGKRKRDPTTDPPPDLVVDVELTVDKLSELLRGGGNFAARSGFGRCASG
jgi:Uma2 family endonuclease